ncbi:MBL fold metallo-hydrolase [Sphingomonas sp.]|uniref:MBL fold metallo-hydrolase n=1 Tax=Sphingomonas sp. TaxID=28214 RepID=UPI002DD692DF|nr:MBL fold metallo-hydrolase [Sphingomonas sp.]
MIRRALRILFWSLLWLVALAGLAVTIVPRFLDRIYHDGPATGHFDGARFLNPGIDDTRHVPTGGSRAGFLWKQATGDDDRPEWPASVPVRPSKPAPRVEGDQMVVTWIGHATVLVQTHGLNILTDPVWSDTAGPFGIGPRRVTAPGVAFDDLPKIDVVLVSHNHYDHLDLATLKRLWDRDRPRIVTSLGNGAILNGAGIDSTALDWGGSVPVGPQARVHVTRNHHWTSRWFVDRNRALWSSFVVALPGGNLFFAGDTGFGDGRWPAEAAALGPIRLALIPIGAFRFEPGQMRTGSHIGPVEAVEVFRRLGAARAIPIHWGTFRLSYEARDTPPRLMAAARDCAGMAPDRFAAAQVGQPVSVPPIDAPLPPSPATDAAAMARCLDTPAVRALR